MRATKVHPIKEISDRLLGHRRGLILGPLGIKQEFLEETLKRLRPTFILYIDGGLKHKKKLSKNKQMLEISVGDGDSGVQRPDYLLPKEKDFSDLAFALTCLKKTKTSMEKIVLLGLSGNKDERPDHFLINLGEVERFVSSKKIPVFLCDQQNEFHFFPAGKNVFNHKGIFSVFSLRKNKIKLSGKARYQLPEWTKLQALSSHGLSNYGTGSIAMESEGPLVVYFAGKKVN